MKITQLLTNLKLWQSTFVAFVFLFSFSINSQNVGDDVFSATNGMLSQTAVDATGGVDGSGTGCSPCGWATQLGVFYAPSNGTHGDVHSVDRMFKFGAGNGYTGDVANAQIVAQEFSLAAAGTYTLTFYHKWVNAGGVDYDAGDGPQLSLKKANASGEWENIQVDEVPLGNIGVNADWTVMSVTYEIAEAGDYRMQIYKAGGNAANPTNMYGSLMVDSFTFVYTAAPAESALTIKGLADLDIPSSAGKFVHLVATGDIADLSVYGLGSANNGGGTDGEEWNFPEGLSATSGDNILLYRDLSVVDAYMDASNTFDLLLEAPSSSSSPVSSNGNDALELFFNGTVVETFGEITFEGGTSNYDHAWAFNDSWAYKVDGEWTYGGPNCSDDEWDNGPISACDSSCPYPFAECSTASDGCSFSLQLKDTYGDTWNGNTIDLLVNDVIVGN